MPIFHRHALEVPEMIAGDGTRLREILQPANDSVDINYSIAYFRLSVGEASEPHRLKSGETYYVLQGKCRLYVDEDSADLRRDSIAHVPPNALQFVENLGSDELICLCVVQPAWRAEDETI